MFNAICKNAKLKDRIYCSFQILNKELSSRGLIQSIPYAYLMKDFSENKVYAPLSFIVSLF